MHEFEEEDEFHEGDYGKRICDFCGKEVDWTEPVTDIDENRKEFELRSCLMCSFDGTGIASREEIQAMMDQMKKNT
ncbi:hypothetical protein CA600_06410 [Paenibacillus sp. VTT E-133280]|uniref:hypothetical protein n=1 Tax=Paenibacillus sp. VTT E-133280 TaxID=1986222 RepID=UPI000BA17601|nr:hypothetical protein [Paenibacillus sp. VTT E-133280]OZQ68441.1 hypothetical protein CA600_06410 [Paenibacillus sp. VTT E-133280]